MSENTFEPQEINLQIQPMPVFIDADGSFKLNTPMLSSFDFDGSIPKFEGEIDAIEVNPGYLIQVESGGEYFSVVSVEADEPDIDNTGIVTINYLDDQGNVVSADYGETDSVSVIYEDWADKSVGSLGWGITAGGNAIFTNVAVRGRIEATEGDISGNLTVSGGLFTSEDAETNGGIVLNNSGFTSYSSSGTPTFNIDAETGIVTIGGYATEEDLESASANVQSVIDDINDRLSASISDLTIDLNSLSASVDFLYDAGFVTDADLITTGSTTINGNNITTGTINANLVSIASQPLLGTRGFKINALGITAYNSASQVTFNVNSQTGAVTISGYATEGDISGFIDESDLGPSGTTTIDGGRITTGTIDANRIDVNNLTVKKLQTGINNLSQRILINDSTVGSDPNIIFTTETGANKFYIYYNYLNGLKIASNPAGTNDTRSVEFDLNGGNIELYGGGTFVGDGSGLTNIAAGNAYRNATTSPTPANKITFGTGAPPTSGRTTGDIHLRYT
jgi:hypothetical protein